MDPRRRLEIALEAARLMAESGLRDYSEAKKRAAARLGCSHSRDLPSNAEIEQAWRDYQRLFQSDAQPAKLAELRQVALQALAFFARFEPRLVDAVLDGTADQFSAVCLHLHEDDPSEVARFLGEHRIPFDDAERRLRTGPDTVESFAVFQFEADGTPIDLTVLPRRFLRQAPWSRVHSGPMARASIGALRALVQSQT